eukprot:UN28467
MEESEEPSKGLKNAKNLELCTSCELNNIELKNKDEGLIITLTNGKKIEVDYLISATGVKPNTSFVKEIKKSDEDAISVNDYMQVLDSENGKIIDDVFSCGDCCYLRDQNCWTQMKLWSQAQLLGAVCAHSMVSEDR